MSEIAVGQRVEATLTFTQRDFDRFAALSGDDNPIHVDPAFSAQTKFGRTVAHGMLLYSTVCALLGEQLPGPGTRQLEQELMFPAATPTGEEVTVNVEVTDVQPAAGLADLTTVIHRADGSAGLQGRTLVCLPEHICDRVPPAPPDDTRTSEAQAFKGFSVGQHAQTQRTFSADDLLEYADLTGDHNPLIVDASYAAAQGLAGSLVPGGLIGGLFSYLLGTELPGRGTNYLKQRLIFEAPAHPGDTLTASVSITRLRPDKQLVNLDTLCEKAAGKVVCRGEALVLISDVHSRLNL